MEWFWKLLVWGMIAAMVWVAILMGAGVYVVTQF